MKPRHEHKGRNPRSKAHDGQVAAMDKWCSKHQRRYPKIASACVWVRAHSITRNDFQTHNVPDNSSSFFFANSIPQQIQLENYCKLHRLLLARVPDSIYYRRAMHYRGGNVWNGAVFQAFCGTERRPSKMSYFVIKKTTAFAWCPPSPFSNVVKCQTKVWWFQRSATRPLPQDSSNNLATWGCRGALWATNLTT